MLLVINSKRIQIINMKKTISLIFCGFSLGYLVGLSISPNVHFIIGGFCTLIISVLTAFAGINVNKNDTKWKFEYDLTPTAILMVFLAIGSSFGIFIRTHNLLSPSSNISSKDSVSVIAEKKINDKSLGVLFSINSTTCSEICRNMDNPNIVRSYLKDSGNKYIIEINNSSNDSLIINFANKICGCSK